MRGIKIDSGGTISLRLSGMLVIEYTCPTCGREHTIHALASELRDWPGIVLACQICNSLDFEVYLLVNVDGHHRRLINP